MEIVDLVLGGNLPVEQRESYMRERGGMLLASGKIGALHIAEVRGWAAPGDAVPLVVRAHACPVVAARDFAFEVENIGKLHTRRGRLVMASVLVQPRNRIRTVAAIECRSGNRRRTVFRQSGLRK